jgi:hypothetical protein
VGALVLFQCRICGLPLTQPLTRLDDPSRLCEEDEKAHVPRGFYWVAPDPADDGGYYTEAAGDLLVNLEDVTNTRHHPDRRRLTGCCGLDGCNGRNTVCERRHVVGTERSDCWHAHSLALDPAAVTTTSLG